MRSFVEQNNKITKNKVSHDKNTYVKYGNTKTVYEIVRNISLDDKVNNIMNNGESINETTLATFKESNVKANAQEEASDASDKIYLHVNGEQFLHLFRRRQRGCLYRMGGGQMVEWICGLMIWRVEWRRQFLK